MMSANMRAKHSLHSVSAHVDIFNKTTDSEHFGALQIYYSIISIPAPDPLSFTEVMLRFPQNTMDPL